jgi:predicted permease
MPCAPWGEERARANIDILCRQILTEYAGQPAEGRRREIEKTYVEMHPASRRISALRTRYSEALTFLLALTGAVLLITCANIANLLLARASARQKEMSVRVAVGASRLRLIRQMLTESMVLASMGGALGVLFAWWASNALAQVVAGGSTAAILIDLNLRMLFFTGLVSLSTGVLFGLAPALRATGVEAQHALKETGGSVSGRQRLRLGRLLVTGQVTMTLLLLVAAGAFVRSLRNLHAMDTGFNKENVLMFELDAGQTGYNATQLTSLYDRLLERIGGLPGIQSASFSRVAYNRGIWGDAIQIPGDKQGHIIRGNFVTPRYLETMGIALRAGRSSSSRIASQLRRWLSSMRRWPARFSQGGLR